MRVDAGPADDQTTLHATHTLPNPVALRMAADLLVALGHPPWVVHDLLGRGLGVSDDLMAYLEGRYETRYGPRGERDPEGGQR